MAEIDDDDGETDPRILRFRENAKLFAEELRHEVWNCKVGDLLEVIADTTLYDWPDGPIGNRASIEMKCQGQIYRVADLKGRGFDLQLVSGDGPTEIRAMNSEILGWCRVLLQS